LAVKGVGPQSTRTQADEVRNGRDAPQPGPQHRLWSIREETRESDDRPALGVIGDGDIGLPVADHHDVRPIGVKIVEDPRSGPFDLAENADMLEAPAGERVDPPLVSLFVEDDEPFLRFALSQRQRAA
jgi:hypothetical protein